MIRNWLLVSMLLATGVVLGDVGSDFGHAAEAAEMQAQAEESAAEAPEAEDNASAGETEAGAEEDADAASEDGADDDSGAGSDTGSDTGSDEAQEQRKTGPKHISGMSILGNQEAPKSLVIVPWKSSQLGESVGISPMLDDSRQPVDREVFMRALIYYEIRSRTSP